VLRVPPEEVQTGATFNNQVRYIAYELTSGQEAQIMSTGNLYDGLTWSRSTTTLTVTSTSHGLTVGDYVVIRNMSEDYSYLEIQTVADSNTFTLTVVNSGGSSGTEGAYIPSVRLSSVTQAGATVNAPSAGNVQVNSISISTGTKTSSTFVVTMPNNISNGSGDNNSLTDQNPPIISVFNLSNGSYNASGTIAINTSSNFNVFQVGAIATFVNNLIRFQF
jgi:hypothetical protein